MYVSNFAILNHRSAACHWIVVTWLAVAYSAGGEGGKARGHPHTSASPQPNHRARPERLAQAVLPAPISCAHCEFTAS